MSGWLEQYVRPRLEVARKAFFWEYVSIYDRWSKELSRTANLDDQASMQRLVSYAEDALRTAAQDKPVRLWLSAIRTLPLLVVDQIVLPNCSQARVEVLRIASQAACLFGDHSDMSDEDVNGMLVDSDWLSTFLDTLSFEIGRFLGASHTYYYARGWYRIVGKGGKPAPPVAVDMEVALKALDSLPPGSIMLVPSVTFLNEAEIMPQVTDYDRRVRESRSLSGLLQLDGEAEMSGQRDPGVWWSVASVSVGSSHMFSIHYPLQKITLNTVAYALRAESLKAQLDHVAPFGTLFESRLGMDFAAFERSCRSVDAIVRNQTGILKLQLVREDEQITVLQSRDEDITGETTRAGFLYSVTARGLLRAPKLSWLAAISDLNRQGGASNPRREAETFLKLFTRVRGLDHDLEPGLFLQVDEKTVVLDFLISDDFFELCLRKVTSLDNAKNPDARRGAHFEQNAWETLRRNPDFKLAVKLNKKLNCGEERGEIDIAFFVEDVLVVLECKSWQKRVDYFRGDRQAVLRRHDQLRKTLSDQVDRNVSLLLKSLSAEPAPRAILSFVCVASAEFVISGYPGLWYGATPRIVTPLELNALISDKVRWETTIIACSESNAGTLKKPSGVDAI